MYSISKEVHFCYGHRLLNHSGPCRHLHGHSARALINLESATLDKLDMVCDFADLSRFVNDWLNRTIDHNLLLHKDDPIIPLLRNIGERYYVLDCNPTAETIARMIFEVVATGGFPVIEVTVYETPTAYATYK